MKTHADLHLDIRKGQFSATTLMDYLSCPRLFYYRHVLSKRPTQAQIDLHFGSCMHMGIGTWYATGKNEVAALKAFALEWAKKSIVGTEKKSAEIGIQLLHNYFRTYANDQTHYLPNMIETDFRLSMGNGTTFMGIIDRVEQSSGFNTIWDTKTSSQPLTDWYFKRYENDFQTTGYYYAINELCGSCQAVGIDAIRSPYTDDTCFQRKAFFRTELQLSEWLNTYYKITDEIMAMLERPADELAAMFYQNHNSCADYGGCKFLPICQHGPTHPALQIDFVTAEGDSE